MARTWPSYAYDALLQRRPARAAKDYLRILELKDPMTAAAAIDRLVHQSVILELNVPSYRAEQAKKSRPTPPASSSASTEGNSNCRRSGLHSELQGAVSSIRFLSLSRCAFTPPGEEPTPSGSLWDDGRRLIASSTDLGHDLQG